MGAAPAAVRRVATVDGFLARIVVRQAAGFIPSAKFEPGSGVATRRGALHLDVVPALKDRAKFKRRSTTVWVTKGNILCQLIATTRTLQFPNLLRA